MHPPLTIHKHEECQSQIIALLNCHSENKFLKLFGLCNKLKTEVNECFQKEFEVIRKANYEKGMKARKRREELWKEFEQ